MEATFRLDDMLMNMGLLSNHTRQEADDANLAHANAVFMISI